MKIEYVPIEQLKEYDKNTKDHTPKQIGQIAKSIQDFGMNDPIAVWQDNSIIEGHGRLAACKKLGLKEVPIIRLDKLTDEQRKAYSILHNSLNMETGFNLENLASELDSISLTDIDMSEFSLNVDDVAEQMFVEAVKHEENKENVQNQVLDILNLGKAQFDGVGPYDMPTFKAVKDLPDVKEWIGFNYVLSDKDPTGKGVHFFIDDYQFERLWNNPDKYIEKLKKYAVVCTPDFSPYADMPKITQLWNHYRKQWLGAYMQQEGVTVIPTVRSSTSQDSLEWYLDGLPKGGAVIISSMWTTTADEQAKENNDKEYLTMVNTLKPTKIFVYGGKRGLPVQETDNVEYIQSFTEKREF